MAANSLALTPPKMEVADPTQVMWNWAKIEGLHRSVWPVAGMERAKWKNREQARRYTVTNEVFEAIYAEAEPMLRDCMDLASATRIRLTDCRTVTMPAGDLLRLEANKTGKDADFDHSLSQVLPELIARRRALKALLMLLSMPDGKVVTEAKLRGAYDRARVEAAKKAASKARRRSPRTSRHVAARPTQNGRQPGREPGGRDEAPAALQFERDAHALPHEGGACETRSVSFRIPRRSNEKTRPKRRLSAGRIGSKWLI